MNLDPQSYSQGGQLATLQLSSRHKCINMPVELAIYHVTMIRAALHRGETNYRIKYWCKTLPLHMYHPSTVIAYIQKGRIYF